MRAPLRRRQKDRKSTRLNSSHHFISYAVFCLKKKIAMGGLTDPRVTYWESAQLIARLRATMTAAYQALLPTNMVAGHGVAFFFFNDPATTEIYPLSLHGALPF